MESKRLVLRGSEVRAAKRLARAEASKLARKNPNNSYQTEALPIYRAKTFKDLVRMQPPAPALGYIEVQEEVVSYPVYDETGNVISYEESVQYYPAGRYFVRTYPPMPKVDFLKMPVQDAREVTWSTKIYQPSAGISGAIVYFDQDIKVTDVSFSRDAELYYPSNSPNSGRRSMYKVADVFTRVNAQNEEVIEAIRVDYANGLDTTKLAWLEVDILPPWGRVKLAEDSAGQVTWQLPTYVPPEIPE